MRIKVSVFCLALVLSALTTSAFAGCLPIPYCQIGQIAPVVSITAQKTGDLMGLYYGHIADFTDLVRIVDVTSNSIGPWVFDNQATLPGSKANFGFVTAGDTLVLEIWDQNTGHVYASNPAYSDDGRNHVYGYSAISSNNFSPMVFFGLEDLQTSEQTDWDYNDSEFFLNNVTIMQVLSKNFGMNMDNAVTPEPTSLLLLGTSLLAFRRRVNKS